MSAFSSEKVPVRVRRLYEACDKLFAWEGGPRPRGPCLLAHRTLIALLTNTFDDKLSSLYELREAFPGKHDDAAYEALMRAVNDALTELIDTMEDQRPVRPTRFDRDEAL